MNVSDFFRQGYLDYSELDLIREGDEIDWLQDKNIEDSKFQYLKMDFPTPENTPKWPLVFEKHLNAFAKQQVPRKTRAQHRSGEPVDSNKKTHFCFLGKGFDGEE